jgi:hypothetical protein
MTAEIDLFFQVQSLLSSLSLLPVIVALPHLATDLAVAGRGKMGQIQGISMVLRRSG